MTSSSHESRDTGTLMLPPIDIPAASPPSEEEIERRRIIVDRMLQRRKRIGPIGIRADDLHHLAEAESEL